MSDQKRHLRILLIMSFLSYDCCCMLNNCFNALIICPRFISVKYIYCVIRGAGDFLTWEGVEATEYTESIRTRHWLLLSTKVKSNSSEVDVPPLVKSDTQRSKLIRQSSIILGCSCPLLAASRAAYKSRVRTSSKISMHQSPMVVC
jgi:hypothetical protein